MRRRFRSSAVAFGLAALCVGEGSCVHYARPAEVQAWFEAGGLEEGGANTLTCLQCECRYPGEPLRYAMNVCFAELGTDDCEAATPCVEALLREVSGEVEGKPACEQNRFFLERACARVPEAERAACMQRTPSGVVHGC